MPDYTCTTALSAVDARDRERSQPETSDLSVICKDLHSLFSLIYSLSTKLSLALSPSSPSYSASLPLLQDLAKHASGVVYCVSLLNEVQHGATFIKDTNKIVKGILESLRDLVQTFIEFAACDPSSTSGMAGEDYLVRTAALHDLITTAQGSNGIPKDNRSAVRQNWSVNKATLEDGVSEVTRMIEEAEGDDANHPTADGDDFNDGWDELGLGTNTSLNKDELARSKSVYPILRLIVLLHKRIFLDVLSSTCPVSVPNVAYDLLLEQSHSLLAVADELVATLYPPQDPDSVYKEVAVLMTVITTLHTRLQVFFPVDDGLDVELNQLSIQDTSLSKSRKVNKRWFDTCFDQISRLSSNLIPPSDG
ncbi:hypothetical protein EDD15DRAFT_2191288 [Pisolithus albus]|nr:hypothetical protein EDD15DRAFT_2191288 [Pisolithus albus]